MLFSLIFLLSQITSVWGAEYEIERSQDLSKRIALIELLNGTKISSVGESDLEIKLRIQSPEQELLFQDTLVASDIIDNTLYTLKIKPQGANDIRIELTLVDGFGAILSEIMLLKWMGPPPLQLVRKPFSPSLGFSLQSYEENGVSQFSQTALSLKIGFNQLIASGFDIGLNAFVTPLVLSGGGLISNEKIIIRFFGSNIRFGYTPQWPIEKTNGRLIASLMLGAYWTTTQSTQDLIGFKNMIGPQVFPVLRFKISNQIVLAGYYKYSPIFTGSSL